MILFWYTRSPKHSTRTFLGSRCSNSKRNSNFDIIDYFFPKLNNCFWYFPISIIKFKFLNIINFKNEKLRGGNNRPRPISTATQLAPATVERTSGGRERRRRVLHIQNRRAAHVNIQPDLLVLLLHPSPVARPSCSLLRCLLLQIVHPFQYLGENILPLRRFSWGGIRHQRFSRCCGHHFDPLPTHQKGFRSSVYSGLYRISDLPILTLPNLNISLLKCLFCYKCQRNSSGSV